MERLRAITNFLAKKGYAFGNAGMKNVHLRVNRRPTEYVLKFRMRHSAEDGVGLGRKFVSEFGSGYSKDNEVECLGKTGTAYADGRVLHEIKVHWKPLKDDESSDFGMLLDSWVNLKEKRHGIANDIIARLKD